MTTKNKILQDLENSLNFCDSVIDIFTEKKIACGAQEQGVK
jgi:hypothetical protein